MVDLTYVRKRKTRKIVAIVGAACALLLITLMIVAFLGQYYSPLTISLTNSGASLMLTTSQADDAKRTKYLLADEVPSYTEFDGNLISYYTNGQELDSEDSNSCLTSDKRSTRFFKYTFYVVNTGEEACDYTLTLDLSYPSRTSSSFDLANVLWVRFYENDDLSQHYYTTYAKRTSVLNEETGEYEYDVEKYSYTIKTQNEDGTSTSESVLIEADDMFESNRRVCTREILNFPSGAMIRYTLVCWIEGNDPDCIGDAPVGSGIAVGVNISAHEADTNQE